jgi:hemerythrin
MALMAWKDDYSVKVRRFDEQHKKLMEIVNKLHDVIRDNRGPKVQAEVLTTLAAYTQAHFSDEERLMRHHFFPGFVPHKKAHDRLVAQVRNFQRQAETDGSPVTPGVMIFLRDWLVQHISEEDAKYGAFMNGRGVA